MHTATIPAADVARALCSYAERFHGGVGPKHHVASPLGAWMLLALCAAGSEGRLREELTAALGVDVDTAAAFAGTLLATPHPAVASAAGIWTRPGLPAEGLSQWLARLPLVVERGDVPSQAALDAWAKQHTLGLIERFPVEVDPLTLLLLATALATKVTWREPFETASAEKLAWPVRVRRALLAMPHRSHSQFIAATERAGDVAVHTVEAKEGLAVTSVIAERDVPSSDVLSAAHELAIAVAGGREVARRSLFDLPLGDSPLWTIEEYEAPMSTAGERAEWCMAVLPAWTATSVHNLARPALGFPAAAAALGRLVAERDFDYTAAQSVIARYSRTGFEAAAVSALKMAGAALGPRRPLGLVRKGELRFGHPFAVVAVSTGVPRPYGRGPLTTGFGPWYGLPVFSAWVTEPSEVEDVEEVEEADLDDEREAAEVDEQIRELLARQRQRTTPEGVGDEW